MSKLLIIILFFPLLSLAGGVVGNGGGDLVLCQPSATNSLSGYYNLDYLIDSLYDGGAAQEFEKVVGPNDSFEKNFLRIAKVTQYKFPLFYKSLVEFHTSLLKNDVTSPYRWKKATFGLPSINDEQLRVLLPPNCLNSQTPFLQVIIRNNSTGQNELFYDSQLLSEIENRPLQKSFLFFHEWLRNFTDDPEVIRNANAILHSPNWSLPEAETRMSELIKSGLNQGPINQFFEGLVEINIYDNRIEVSENGTAVSGLDGTFKYSKMFRTHFVVQNLTSQRVLFMGRKFEDRNSGFYVPAGKLVDQVVLDHSFCVYLGMDNKPGIPNCDEKKSSLYPAPSYEILGPKNYSP